jgi:DNA-binding XRE family transcriptional regulator
MDVRIDPIQPTLELFGEVCMDAELELAPAKLKRIRTAGHLLRVGRLSKRISQRHLAKYVGIDQSTLCKREHKANLTVDAFITIAKAMGYKIKLSIEDGEHKFYAELR